VDETDLRHVHELFVVLSLAALSFLLNASTATARYSRRRVVLISTSICTRTQILGGLVGWIMPLRDFHLRASIAVSDIQRAVVFYEGKLGLQVLQSGPSARIAGGSRVYGSGGAPALNVYQSVTAGRSRATMATWYVDDIDQVVDELTAAGVEFARYDEFDHDARGITARAGGGRIAWFRDPDGNTFAVEADA
jgi:catechol 2,3-dioxygenase-like lactoylglutathione lyase family enzyme